MLMYCLYRSERFVSQGIACLKAGLLHAVPTAVIGRWILHRGFAVNSLAAGVALGTLSGLAGVGMLELHCTNFEAPHVMVWHTAVLALSGAGERDGVNLLHDGSVGEKPEIARVY